MLCNGRILFVKMLFGECIGWFFINCFFVLFDWGCLLILLVWRDLCGIC